MRGFASQLDAAVAARGRWLAERRLAEVSPAGDIAPKSDMMRRLHQAETDRIVRDVSRDLNAPYLPADPAGRIAGVYERPVTTPTGKLAVIRKQDTFTLAPWRPALEPLKGRAVTQSCHMAAMSFRRHEWVLIGGAVSIGWMAVVNFIVDSDFKLVLLALALVWAASLVPCVETRR